MPFVVATLKAFANSRYVFANAFSVALPVIVRTQGCANPGLEFANAFGVFRQPQTRHFREAKQQHFSSQNKHTVQ